MRHFSHLFALVWLLLLFHSTVSFGQARSGILAPARATDWSYAGIPGGIPDGSWPNCTTTACNTAYSSPTAANVISACASAPNNTVVRIPAGSYTWSGNGVYCDRSNVVLRGAGTQRTFITLGSGSSIYMSSEGTGGQGPYPTGVGHTSWTGGLTQGNTVLTVASTSALSNGQTVILTQSNAAYVYTTGVEGACTSGNSCGVNVSANTFNGSSTWAQIQEVSIVSVDSSTQITIATPGVGFTASSGLSPVLFYWNTPHNAQYDGIENMSVNVAGNQMALSLPFCDYCWVKNVSLTNATNRGAIFFYFGYRDEADNNYIGGDTGTGHPTQYGIDLLETTFAKVQNNIIVNETTPIITEGSYGTVLGYNYMRRTVADNEYGAAITHLAHPSMQLWEGNVAGTLMYDSSWGSSSHMTMFRNYANGHDPNATNYRIPISAQTHNEYQNIVGNVLGDPTYHSAYQCDISNISTYQNSDVFIYDLGIWNGCISGITSNYDSVVESSLVRWGNWDAVTYNASGSSHHGTRYCTGSGTGSSGADAYNTACTTSETASSDPNYPGLGSPSITLPASFYLSSAPSWWGSVAWPAIGPDVTGGNLSNTGSHANAIPAEVCYNNTTKDANGFLTAFDANVCYASDPTAPSPPTGLSATIK